MSFTLNSNVLRLLRRYLRFCIVGGTGVAVDMGILWVLASPSMLAWNLTLGKVVAAEVAIFNNFIWNDLWTFEGMAAEPVHSQGQMIRLCKFNLICLAGIAISVMLLNLQVYWFRANVFLANLIAIVVASIWNFLMNLKFGWNRSPSGKSARGEPASPHLK